MDKSTQTIPKPILGKNLEMDYQEETNTSSGSVVFIDGDGRSFNKYYELLPEKNIIPRFLKSKESIPSPLKFQEQSQYYNEVEKWYESFAVNDENPFLLSVPIDFNFKRPANPHIPSPQEKINGTKQNRISKTTFSVSQTPLYPSNYLFMVDGIITGNLSNEGNFPFLGPSKQLIPRHFHFTTNSPWNGQLIPQRPNPYFYSSYHDYQRATQKWIQLISKKRKIPIHSHQIKEICDKNNIKGLEIQKSNPTVLTTVPQTTNRLSNNKENLFMPYRQLNIKMDKDKLRNILDNLKQSYLTENKIKQENHNPYSSHLTFCNKIYNEMSENGVTISPVELRKASGIYHSIHQFSIFNNHPRSRISSFSSSSTLDLKIISDFLSMPSFHTSIGYRYSLYQNFIQLFEDANEHPQALEICNSILADFRVFCRIFRLFMEFSKTVAYIPIRLLSYQVPNSFTELNHLLILYSFILHINQFFNQSNSFFVTKLSEVETQLSNVIQQQAKAFYNIFYEQQEEVTEFHFDLLLLLFSFNSKEILQNFEPSFFVVFSKLSTKFQPKLVFSRFLFELLNFPNATFLLFETLTSLENYPGHFLPFASDSFLHFLSILTLVKVPWATSSVFPQWPFLIIQSAINCYNASTNCEYLTFSLYVCGYLKRCLKSHPHLSLLSNFTGILFSAFFAVDDLDHQTILIRSISKLIWHPDSAQVLLNESVAKQIVSFLNSKHQNLSVMTIRLFSKAISSFPIYLDSIVHSKTLLSEYGNALSSIQWPATLEILKLIIKFFRKKLSNPDNSNLATLLKASNVKIRSMLLSVNDECPTRYFYIFKDFDNLLQSKGQIKNILYSLR